MIRNIITFAEYFFRSIGIGGTVGFIFGFPAFFILLLVAEGFLFLTIQAAGLIGIVGMVVGIILGIPNGIVLGFVSLLFFKKVSNNLNYYLCMALISIGVTFFSSFWFFGLIFGGAASIAPIYPTILMSFIAPFVSMVLSRWYLSELEREEKILLSIQVV
jgi:hypothetical protein